MLEIERPDLAWCEVDGILIFLSLDEDRYFRLDGARNRASLAWLARRGAPHWQQPCFLLRPGDWSPPASCPSAAKSRFSLLGVARALRAQQNAQRALRRQPFASVLTGVRSACQKMPPPRMRGSPAATIRSFEQARLLHSTADRCLPRSIALARCLAADGLPVRVVLGVKLLPFAAHCWVQRGSQVLGDSLEEVARYTPILVV